MAQYSGSDGAKVYDLFGTKELPTAFTDTISPRIVAEEIECLNPDSEVIVCELDRDGDLVEVRRGV